MVSVQSMSLAEEELKKLCKAFKDMGIPLAPEKITGPREVVTYLGIEINSRNLTMAIPRDRFDELMEILPWWKRRKTCIKQQLLSLIGKLSFICKVVQPGRIFLRRLINLSMSVEKLHHHIKLNQQALADIDWWHQFLPTWSQRSLIPESFKITSSDLKLFTDASSVGFGAIYGDAWIQGKWLEEQKGYSIDFKEMFAILAAALTWGATWERKRIVFVTDDLPIVQIWHIGSTQARSLTVLVSKLYLLAAQIGFCVSFKHILGNYNPIADSLSRFQESRFREVAPNADTTATRVPEAAWKLLKSIPERE